MVASRGDRDRRRCSGSGARAHHVRTYALVLQLGGDATEFVDARGDEGIGGLRIGRRAGEADRALTDARDRLADRDVVTTVDDHANPVPGKQLGDRQTDAAGSPHDDRGRRARQLSSS
jgi:hypothetical protein